MQQSQSLGGLLLLHKRRSSCYSLSRQWLWKYSKPTKSVFYTWIHGEQL